jgi:hypothetical protein
MPVDLLRLKVRRARGCCQRFREVARGDLRFADLASALKESSGCSGKGCRQCAEAALRLVDYVGSHRNRGIDPVDLARWVREYVDPLDAEFRLRAAGTLAYLQRHSETDSAIQVLDSTAHLLESVPIAERAHHLARSAFVLTDARLLDDARHAAEQSRELYEMAAPDDPERGPACAAVAVAYIEIAVAYVNAEARFEHAAQVALGALSQLCEAEAPRTWHALTTNLLTLLVSAWRAGVRGIDPLVILKEIESRFSFDSRRSDPVATTMRWMWVICAGQAEGLTQRVRNRIRHVRAGLIAQRRWQDLDYFELDILWIICYHHRHSPLRSHLLSQSRYVKRAFCELGHDLTPLAEFERAVESGTYLTREQLEPLFVHRGIRTHLMRDLRLR